METINEIQKQFILKAIRNISCLYDFENLNNKEFKENYNIDKRTLIEEANKLTEVLK